MAYTQRREDLGERLSVNSPSAAVLKGRIPASHTYRHWSITLLVEMDTLNASQASMMEEPSPMTPAEDFLAAPADPFGGQ